MTFKPFDQKGDLYFVTAKIEGGKHLFSLSQYAWIILNSLKWLREQIRIKLYAFVVMPNHVHFILQPQGKWTASQICYAFEKFTAHEILKLLKEEGRKDLIIHFEKCAENFSDRKHKIWQDIQAKNIFSEKFFLEKVEYLHNNPIRKGWNLVENRADYKYSSACFYDKGEKSIIEIDDAGELWEIPH